MSEAATLTAREFWRGELMATLAEPRHAHTPSFADGRIGGRPIIVYGAGECSHWFYEIAMKMHGCRPLAVLDRVFKMGDVWHGVPAYPPADYVPTAEVLQEAVVVVCVGNVGIFAEIESYLRQRGFRHIRTIADIYEIHNPFGEPRTAYAQGRDFYVEHTDEIFAAFDLFADDASYEVFVRFLQTHITRRPQSIPRRPRDEQYFPADVPLANGHRRYVCCGAYDGDTLRLLQQKVGKVDAVACFEPEPHIFARLTEFLRNHDGDIADEVVAWPCAVYGHNGQLNFKRGDGLGSRLSDSGEHLAQCVTLDAALARFSPSFISMDVEGAEPEVLRGAAGILAASRPELGICVYHSPDHVWTLPRQLHALNLGYRFYLRNYTGFAIETVLYATL